MASDFPSKEATKEAKRTRELHLGKVEEHEKCAKDVERAQNKAANAKQRKEKLFYEAESAKEVPENSTLCVMIWLSVVLAALCF